MQLCTSSTLFLLSRLSASHSFSILIQPFAMYQHPRQIHNQRRLIFNSKVPTRSRTQLLDARKQNLLRCISSKSVHTSSRRRAEDKDDMKNRLSDATPLKNDPEVKSILDELYSDFEEKSGGKNCDKLAGENGENGEEDRRINKQGDLGGAGGTGGDDGGTGGVGDGTGGGAGGSAGGDDGGSGRNQDLQSVLLELFAEQDIKENRSGSSLLGYSEYRDSDAVVIYDVDEERQLLEAQGAAAVIRQPARQEKRRHPTNKYQALFSRQAAEGEEGESRRGVLNMPGLVSVLRGEKVGDLAVIRVEPAKQYADHLIVGTGRNARHLLTVSRLIIRLYKDNCGAKEMIPNIEGEQTKGKTGWLAMDLGNVVVHLFTQEQREQYDIESLWLLGSELDDLTREAASPSNLEELMASVSLEEFEPLTEAERKEETGPQQRLL